MRSAKNQVILILRSLLSLNSRTSSSIKPSSSSSLEPLYQNSGDLAKENELIMDKDDDDQPSGSSSSSISLTVWRKSLLLTCSGFTVIDPEGNLAYRVDNYTERPREVVLMDGHGKCILTICRRRKNLMGDHWLVYEGDYDHNHNHNNRIMMMLNCVLQTSLIKRILSSKKHPRRRRHHHQQQQILAQQPVYCVKKQRMKNYIFPSSTSYIRRLLRHNQQTSNKPAVVNKVLAHVYLTGDSESADSVNRDDHHPQIHDVAGDSSHKMKMKKKKWPVYVVVGSYCKRNCTVWDYERRPKVVAEVKSKEAVKDGVSFGKQVFHLIVRPGFDPDFAMAFVLLLDQMFT